MRYNFYLFLICLGSITISHAQEHQPLRLDQAVNMAWKNSYQSKRSAEKVNQAKKQIKISKNNQYPDFGLSGEFLYLTSPNLNLKFPLSTEESENEDSGNTMPEPNYLMFGQANISVPLFSGFKLRNTVKASQSSYKAQQSLAKKDQVDLALKTVHLYTKLYQARKTVKLIKENLKSSQQRVQDFSNLEDNGLLARNDLLKAKLQASDIELSLAKAKKNERLINYNLVLFLKLPSQTSITIDTLSFVPKSKLEKLNSQHKRPEIEALEYHKKSAEQNIKIIKGNRYPSVALTGGYMAADIENTLSVTNALNVGLGISYNISDLFKNKSKVNVAKSKLQEIDYQLEEAKDQISLEVRNAQEEYTLALHKREVYKESKAQADENYRIVKDKFDNGLLDTRDLLEADVIRLQSRIDLANSKANITLKYYELKKAQGQLINEFSN